MGTKFPEFFAALDAGFEPHEIKHRPGQGGKQLSYITATTVANRLDNVAGPESWNFELAPWGNDQLIGTLIVTLPNGTVIRRSNVGGKADMQAGDDAAKSCASDALKRCASLLGIGRYLYQEGVPDFVDPETLPPPETSQRSAPSRPSAAPSRESVNRDYAPRGGSGDSSPRASGTGNVPRTGRALFAWLKEQGQEHGLDLVKEVNAFAKKCEFTNDRIIDFDENEVHDAHQEAVRIIYGG